MNEMFGRGLIAGTFDILHPGYIHLFNAAKLHCRYLIVAVHEDPHLEREDKYPPLLSLSERIEALVSIRHINLIEHYKNEKELHDLLEFIKPDVIFLGADYKGKPYTGEDLDIPVIYITRDHGWSYTKLREMIVESWRQK